MDVKENVKNTDTWLRGLLILLFGGIFYVAFWIIWLLVIFQFGFKLITGRLNGEVGKVCNNLTQYVMQILHYVTFQSEYRPFPFNPWPEGTDAAESQVDEAATEDSTTSTDTGKDGN